MNDAILNRKRKNRTFLKDKTCRIVKRASGVDDYGAPIDGWQYLTGDLWCYARQLSQEMVWQGIQFDTNETRFFVLNFRDDVSIGDLVKYACHYYQITRLDTEDDYHGDLFVYAKDAAEPDEILPAE
ncbi:MAG: head-tail adaptor protein [Desulfovibrio sp.]|nr:head-tail adaptor protein [Desulfovibrio sp.]